MIATVTGDGSDDSDGICAGVRSTAVCDDNDDDGVNVYAGGVSGGD